jgi:hypothetical protein
VLYKYKNVVTSYSELMGYPKEQLTSDYWFPWYKTAAGEPVTTEPGTREA